MMRALMERLHVLPRTVWGGVAAAKRNVWLLSDLCAASLGDERSHY